MIYLTANGKPFTLPSHWGEVTYKQWKQIEGSEDVNHIASVLCGFKIDASALGIYLCWMEVPFNIEDWDCPKEVLGVKIDFNISEKTYGQKLLVHQMKQGEFNKIVAIYLQPLIENNNFNFNNAIKLLYLFDELRLMDLIPVYQYIINQFNVLVTKEKKELSSKPTSEQTRAGISMFDSLGMFNTIDALAGGDILKHEAIYNLDYNTIFLKLKKSNLEVKFKNNYEKIMQSK